MRNWMKLGALIMLGILGVFFYVSGFDPNKPALVSVDLPCSDLTLGCGNASMQVKTDSAPQVMHKFNLHVVTSTKNALMNAVYVDFAMQGMSMGLNRYRLIRQPEGDWQGEIILPVCVQGRSDWLMEVTVNSAKETKRYHLAFQATK